eukprot:7387424-Prymnesium_polylepis.1
MPGDAVLKQAAQKKLQVRRWLQQLLKANLLRGSIDDGVSVHDLVRDCMMQRADAAGEGGLRALQREAVRLLVEAFDAGGPAASYASASLQWHVRQARQPGVDVHADALLMGVLGHGHGAIRKQGALGIGVSELHDAADACDAAGEHVLAAELVFATCAVRDSAAGAEARRAWASLQQLEALGGSSSTSRALESRVLGTLVIATEGGYAFGSAEHEALLQRMGVLGRRALLEQGGEAGAASRAMMDAQVSVGSATLMAVFALEGTAAYPGPMTREMVVQAGALWKDYREAYLQASACATDAGYASVLSSYWMLGVVNTTRQHVLPDFDAVAICGAGGARIRESIDRCARARRIPRTQRFVHTPWPHPLRTPRRRARTHNQEVGAPSALSYRSRSGTTLPRSTPSPRATFSVSTPSFLAWSR